MASPADAAMQLLREAMEGFLLPEDVSATIFEALAEHGAEIPGTGHELDAFVRGPLTRALETRLAPAELSAMISGIEPILRGMMASAPPPKRRTQRAASVPAGRPEDDEPTHPGPAPSEAFVLVLSQHDALQRRLELAVGSGLRATTAKNTVAVHAAVLGHSPSLSVVDATDPPHVAAAEAARAIRRAPEGSRIVVWGVESAYGREVMLAFEGKMPSPMGLSVEEGVEPLLDLVRAHGLPAGALAAAKAAAKAAVPGRGRPTPRIGDLSRMRRGDSKDR
jgi:hypothetical protein